MAQLSRTGKVTLGASTIAEMAKWTINGTAEVVEAPRFQDEWTRLVGDSMRKWNCSVEGWYDPETDTAQATLWSKWLSGGSIDNLRLYTDDTYYLTPDTVTDANAHVRITSLSVNAERAGVNSITVSFEGSGPLYRTS